MSAQLARSLAALARAHADTWRCDASSPATVPASDRRFHIVGGGGMTFRNVGTFGFDCGVDMENSSSNKFEDFLARR